MRLALFHTKDTKVTRRLDLVSFVAPSCPLCEPALLKTIRILTLVLLLATALLFAQSPKSGLPSASDIIGYLNQTLDWHRQLAVEEELTSDPADTLFVSDLRQLDTQIVRQSFDFARAAAPLVGGAEAATASGQQPSRFQSLQRSEQAAENEAKQTQAEAESVRAQLARAPASKRGALRAQLDELQSEIELAQTRSQTLRLMLQFISTAGTTGGGNLSTQIEELQRSVPETLPANPNSTAKGTTSTSTTTAPAQTSRRQQPSGILALITDLVALKRKVRTLDQAIASTDSLAQASTKVRAPMIAALTAATKQGEQLAQAADTANPAQLEDLKHQLDALTGTFKQLSGVVLPLGEQSILLDSYRTNLLRWRDTVRSQYDVELKEAAIRAAVFGAVIIVVLVLFELWRSAIFRYVHDVRRRYQFLLLRRILLWFVIGITIAFALASEIGSIATFAGLITAGVAVALQNVIMAVAGYFFLIGKYGVRVGDRVQISGVTGDVVDVGLIRLHLMEVGGSGSDRHPTGRIVVFSNAVVFQPSASFYKQIPGTSFQWHEVSLILAPDSDYRQAEKRIVGAVETVFAGYHERIEQQHRQMEETLNVTVPVPKPHSRLQLTQNGLEVVIRYPVEMDTASDIDDKITRELLRELDKPPRLRLVGSGTPNIQPVAGPEGASKPAESDRVA